MLIHLKHHLSHLRKDWLSICQKVTSFGYQSSIQWRFCAWKSLELGLKVYDPNQVQGHLKDQSLLFGFISGYIILHNQQCFYPAHGYKSSC